MQNEHDQQDALSKEMASTSMPSVQSEPTGKITLVMIGLCLAVFLTGMDQTILATVTPIISDDFHALGDVSWWSAIYLFTLSVFQLFYGKLYSLSSIKTVYVTAIALFEIGSLICATSPNSAALIAGRAIAGLGAAGIFTGSIMVTTKVIPLDQRARYLGIMSGVFGIAAIVGPFIGGAITERTTWRWCFGINLPLGVVTIVICIFFIRTPMDAQAQTMSFREKLGQFDILGTAILIGSLVCLLLAMQWGGSAYPWNGGRVISLFVVAGVLAILFSLVQIYSRTSHTIPSSISRNPSVWLAASYAICFTGGMYIAILYVPIWFQAIQDRSTLGSAVMLTPIIGGYVVCSVIAGIVTSLVGYYNPAMIVGTVVAAIGAGLLTTVTPNTTTASWVGYGILYGAGLGFGFGQPSYVVQTVLKHNDVSIGVTLITLVQNLSATISVTVGQTIFQNTLTARLQTIAPDIDVPLIGSSGATELISQFPASDRSRVLDAYSTALVRTLYISLGLSCVSVIGATFTKWKSMKGPAASDG